MLAQKSGITDITTYIAGFPEDTQKMLEQLRATILKAAPGAEESISYGMPAYKWQGPLVYFAACKNHIGFYPTPSAIKTFQEELSQYKSAKGSVQFPLDGPLPLQLITKIILYRVNENLQKAALKTKQKKNDKK